MLPHVPKVGRAEARPSERKRKRLTKSFGVVTVGGSDLNQEELWNTLMRLL
jgi:hypothetical protein